MVQWPTSILENKYFSNSKFCHHSEASFIWVIIREGAFEEFRHSHFDFDTLLVFLQYIQYKSLNISEFSCGLQCLTPSFGSIK